MLFKDINSSSSEDNVEEKSEAVLFQMQYAVAAGQFTISLHGINTTAQRSSLKQLFSKVTCSVGSVPSNNGKRCGEYLVASSFFYLFVYLLTYLINLFIYLLCNIEKALVKTIFSFCGKQTSYCTAK